MFDRFLEIAHFHNDNDRRIAQFVFFVFLLAAAAVFGFGGAVHGVRRRSNDWAHAARNAVASKLVEANPGGLKPHIDMLARIAWLREPLRQHYEREWQSLLELCGLNPCRKAIPWTVEMEEQLARRLVEKYPNGLDRRVLPLDEHGEMMRTVKKAYYWNARRFFAKHYGLRYDRRLTGEVLASTLVQTHPEGLEPQVAFHVERLFLRQIVKARYAAKRRGEVSLPKGRDR